MEYAPETLLDVCKKSGWLSDYWIKDTFKQLLDGLEKMHTNKIYHRDIKLEDILVFEHRVVKYCDFGLAARRRVASDQDDVDEGTLAYMPPDFLGGRKYRSRSDVYSLGVVLYALVNGGRLPFT